METKKEKITILVCAHKPDEHIRNYPPYKAIQVGAALHPEMDLGFLKDNVGDNISEKNPKYCELSAIYWGWRNLKNVEYAGLAHYRRYFDIDINDDNVDELMKGYDMMVVKRMKTFYFAFNKGGLTYATSQDDFWLCLDTLLYMRPEYVIATNILLTQCSWPKRKYMMTIVNSCSPCSSNWKKESLSTHIADKTGLSHTLESGH